MSDAGESGDIKESFVEDENKVDIETTSISLNYVKNEPKEELDFEEDSYAKAKQYRITCEYKHIFGEPSHQIKIKEDYDNLIGFLDNDFIMENAMIKLETIKEEEDNESLNNLHCSKCKGIYKGYCLKCSSLSCILNNNLAFVSSKSESNTIPSDILEIRETSRGKGVYLLRTLPINIIFGPFEGVFGIETLVGHSWKIIANKLSNIKSGNWMKNIFCAASASFKNLDIFQIDGNLYFRTSREIIEGEELLIWYDDDELQQLNNSEECLYTPLRQEKSPIIFACIMCCLGFSSHKCLMEHKSKYCQIKHSRSMNELVLIECHYCKMRMEKWEHEEYHVAYCFEIHQRRWSGYSEAVDRSDTVIEEMEGDCGTKGDGRTHQRDICSRPQDRRDDFQFDSKDYQCFSEGYHETHINDYGLAERLHNEQIQNTIEPNNESHFENHLNKHRRIIEFQCDICIKKFGHKVQLEAHIRNKHTDDASVKDYKCSECFYQTNNKSELKKHLTKHRVIKPFKCDICMKKFVLKGNLKVHRKNKHAGDGSAKDYMCLECSYQTNYKNCLKNHLNKHRGISFKCDICMMKFTMKGSLKTHMKNKHTDDGSAKDYKCSQCSYQTNYKSYFQIHLDKHRDIKPFNCDICMKKFWQEEELKSHITNKHANDGSMKDNKCTECFYQTNNKSDLKRHLNKHRGIKPFACDICMKTFTRKSYLKIHMDTHAEDERAKDYKCSECSYSSNYKNRLEIHLNKHRGIKPFTCDICMVDFVEKSSLTRHIKNKHADNETGKSYKCLECSYQTNRKSDLQKHLNKHRGIKPFKCDICMQEFGQKGHLKAHILNKHIDNGSTKDYKCAECSFQTSYKRHLQMHLNSHKGIKPFKCDICMKIFGQSGQLKAHARNKHTDDGSGKDYKCAECSFQTNYKSHLQRHLNKHRGIKPFRCDICMKKFTRKYNFTKHMKNKHTDNRKR